MNDEIREVIGSYPNVLLMLKGLSRELWQIFLPDTADGLAMLEADILSQRKRDVERDKIMAIQRLCGFPLRPNAPLQDVVEQAKLQGLKNDHLLNDYREDNPNSI